VPEPSKDIEKGTTSAFERWADDHPHLANAFSGLVTGPITGVAVALAGEPAGMVALAIVAVGAATVLMCEYFTFVLGRSLLGTGRPLYTGDDPRTAAWTETFFGGGDGGGGSGDGGGGGGS
jgi:hypothetical protein